ncbi:hypothetical protein Tcan_07156 [Toxocara canis]|uniref:Uncharacterized protein n=2 Tax=Toxocara canis TaxID=6265 RepID=A0A0B2VGK7_TOXCA|nr:hypothetical protein Tcan_07156 [Toxocara canis]VDM27114.1 unnamed protein product [Toxocara canis]
MTNEEEDECPTFLWYFVASFGYTILILIILIAYLIMYSSHFMWALKKRKEPKLKKKRDKTSKTTSKDSKESENKDDKGTESKGSKESPKDGEESDKPGVSPAK